MRLWKLSPVRCTLPLAFALLACALAAPSLADVRADGPRAHRPGDPVISLPLEDFGFEQAQPRLLLSGATMFSVNFVDNTHILLTYNTHGLIPRVSDGTNQENDRLVAALLLELPSGKVLARTQWHTRDREQYLWPLSHGLFLLRLQTKLTVLDPLNSLHTGDPFQQQKFLDMARRIGYIAVSPGGDLLVVETVNPSQDGLDSNIAGDVHPQFTNLPLAQINFFRMVYESAPGGPPHLTAQSAGVLSSRAFIRVPATSDGFLDMTKESAGTWLFDFQSHAGKRLELAPFDTTCLPSPFFISRTDFVAFGCAGNVNRVEFGGFNLRGEQPWVQMLSGQQIAPIIVSAPDAGRFAFSRLVVSGSFYDIDNLTPEDLSAQEVQVIQSHDGRILLKAQPSPIQRTGQNFDLSPDGLNFTMLRNGNLEVYRLPELSAKDQDQLKLAASELPEKNDARILLRPNRPAEASLPSAPSKIVTVNGATGAVTQDDSTGGLDLTPASSSASAQPSVQPAAQPAPSADTAPRKPPSLYDADHPKPPDR
jgi:hypothetical protein